MATLNVGMKINRVISGATTVTANAWAIVDYAPTSMAQGGGAQGATSTPVTVPASLTRNFGPGQSVPATFTEKVFRTIDGSGGLLTSLDITYTLRSGVELINTI